MLDPYDMRMGETGSVTVEQLAAQAEALGITWGEEQWNGEVLDRSEVYAFLPRAYFEVLHAALRTLDVYPTPVYEACGGIGDQRRVNRHAREM